MSKIILNGIEYSNGITYQELQPVIYSEEEREIGCFVDGKPLYQKTIYHQGGVNGQISIPHGIANIEKVVSASGRGRDNYSSSISYEMPIPRIATDNYNVGVSSVDGTSINFAVPSAFGSRIVDIYITLQYTKTTDIAGSGIWNGQGGLAHHYSTNETVIGTWIDGKPLYEKTFELTQQLDLTQNTWVKSELDQGTMKGLFYVLFSNDLGACLNNIVGGFIDNKIAFNSPRTISIAPAENTKVTLQYTKTTDV